MSASTYIFFETLFHFFSCIKKKENREIKASTSHYPMPNEVTTWRKAQLTIHLVHHFHSSRGSFLLSFVICVSSLGLGLPRFEIRFLFVECSQCLKNKLKNKKNGLKAARYREMNGSKAGTLFAELTFIEEGVGFVFHSFFSCFLFGFLLLPPFFFCP